MTSDLQRGLFRKPLPPPVSILEEHDEGEDDHGDLPELPSPAFSNDSSSSASSTGTVVPEPSRNLFERPRVQRSKGGPLPWTDFFDQELWLKNESTKITFHAYLTPPIDLKSPLFVTHHGAGSSGLSFATFATEIRKHIPNCGILSYDARDHGLSHPNVECPQELDLSLSTLAADLVFTIRTVQQRHGWSKSPPIVLLGHSLGGAVVTETAYKKLLGNDVLGYGVLDVVEGSAIDALQSMEQYLLTRPRSFPSLATGIDWHTRSRTIRNTISARVSVPPLLEQKGTEDDFQFYWRTDLSATKPFWEDWFIGLSAKFLGVPGVGKLLLLAGTDRLDKELMIGQMQGKYQLQVFPEAGHFLHEDQPEKTANVVADFWKRNDRSTLVLPPKVDDLIKQGKLKAALQR